MCEHTKLEMFDLVLGKQDSFLGVIYMCNILLMSFANIYMVIFAYLCCINVSSNKDIVPLKMLQQFFFQCYRSQSFVTI